MGRRELDFTQSLFKTPTIEYPYEESYFIPPLNQQHTIVMKSIPIDGVSNAFAEPGQHPLIVISHGNAGSMWGHHDIASALARAGYVVAALEHSGDNAHDKSKIGTAEIFLDRPRQLSALITAVLADPIFGKLVDSNRIGALGFSLGSYTALVASGVRPNFRLIDDYCNQSKTLGFCTNRARIRTIDPQSKKLADPRVKATVALAPFGIFFDKLGLMGVKVPVLLYAAEDDQELPLADNAQRIKNGLPESTSYFVIPKAGHFVFLAPCSSVQAKIKPQLCNDPRGVERIIVHKKIYSDIIGFFDKNLK